MRGSGTRGLRDLVDLLLPGACLGCGGRIPPGRSDPRVCGVCRSRLRPVPAPGCRRCQTPLGTGAVVDAACQECRGWPPCLDAARSAVVLEPPADRLVHQLKYEGWRELAGLMAVRMARLAPPRGPEWVDAAVVPVPTSDRRRRRRGYNQAGILAEALTQILERPVVNALKRRGGGGSQVVLHPTQRRANVKTAFGQRSPASSRVEGRRVILVDDVLTTGATASSAARVLEGLGAERVAVVTFARALPYRTEGTARR